MPQSCFEIRKFAAPERREFSQPWTWAMPCRWHLRMSVRQGGCSGAHSKGQPFPSSPTLEPAFGACRRSSSCGATSPRRSASKNIGSPLQCFCASGLREATPSQPRPWSREHTPQPRGVGNLRLLLVESLSPHSSFAALSQLAWNDEG